MSNVLERADLFRRKSFQRVASQISTAYNLTGDNAEDFRALAENNLGEAIRQLPTFIERARNVNQNRALGEGLGGGPNPDWIMPLINAVGDFYTEMELEDRKELLVRCLHYFDRLNVSYVQQHMKVMRSALLIGDIYINRWVYFPGFMEEIELLKIH